MAEMNLDQAAGWKPEVGDVLVGEVLDVTRAVNFNQDGYYPIITIKPDRGSSRPINSVDEDYSQGDPVAIHGFHTVLRNRLIELKPLVGERIGIKYVSATEQTGEKGRKGNKPAVYNVRVEGRGAEDAYAGMRPTGLVIDESKQVSFDDPEQSVTQDEDDIPF